MATGQGPWPSETADVPRPHPQYGPRTCRICLEEVQPTFDNPIGILGLGARSRPVYLSEDPELGRLISPCRCSGSQKYVHYGCLEAWRKAAPAGDRNMWSCPTCKFEYKMSRISWAKWINSAVVHAVLTVTILAVTIFMFGFVADPILDLWNDPVKTIIGAMKRMVSGEDMFERQQRQRERELLEPASWFEHWCNGFVTLGVIGFVKSFVFSPYQWMNYRRIVPRRAGTTGRERFENISLTLVLLGIFTFLIGVWKGLSKLSWHVLQRVEARVLDIGEAEADEVPESASGLPKRD